MEKIYQAFFGLSLFVVLFLSIAAVGAGHGRSAMVFLKMCAQPMSWDITYRKSRPPIIDMAPEEVKAEMMRFASIYQSETEIIINATMVVGLIVLAFSLTGWLRERHFRKSSGEVPG